MAKKEGYRTYMLRDKDGKEGEGQFTGRVPRQAALKAAVRGHPDIRLRERGRKNKDGSISIHVFEGSNKVVDKPKNAPDWMANKIKIGVVKKIGVERIEKAKKK